MKTNNLLAKRIAATLLTFVLLLSMTACSSSDSGVSSTAADSSAASTTETNGDAGEASPAWQSLAGEDATLTWYINYSWYRAPDEANAVAEQIKKDTGITIEFVVPAGNESEKLNSMIASDTLPDLVTLGYWETQIGELIDADMLYSFNELADEYDPYFYEVADEERLGWYTSEDGNVYQYPNSSYSPSDYEELDNIASNETFLVRKDMYEAIGSPDMTTTEGFVQAIKDAVEMFPTVNGQSIIPIGLQEFTDSGNASLEGYLQDFLAIPYEDEDGNAYDRSTDPEYITWLKTFRELGAEGYLVDDIFIDQRAQMEEKIAQGLYFCMLFQRSDIATQQQSLYNEDPESIYIAVDGPKNSNGDDHTLAATGIAGWTVTLIPKTCSDPERAIAISSYFMSEYGQKLILFGPEGIGYDEIDGEPVENEETKELKNSAADEYADTIGGNDSYWMYQDTAMQSKWADDPVEPFAQMQEWTYPYVISTSQYTYTLLTDSEENEIVTKVNNLWGSTLPKLLLASTEEEFDTLWNEFNTKKANYGYDTVLEEYSKQLAENKQKLGIE